MKKLASYFIGSFILINISCQEEFLEIIPQGQLSASQLADLEGIEKSLIASYTMLNGNLSGQWNAFSTTPDMWVWGEVTSDNAHKGSDPGDIPDIGAIETYNVVSTNSALYELWQRRFEGILRVNNTLKLLNMSPEVKTTKRGQEISAEAHFLRAHYYFDLWKVFKYVPYVTEETPDPSLVSNEEDILPLIQEDMEYAVENLPVEKPRDQVGRPNKLVAKSYLGKIYLYEEKYDKALPLFKDVIAAKPDLATLDFRDNFDVTKRNSPETIFGVQSSVNDGTGGSRGNVGNMLNAPFKPGLPVGCCGAFTPSFDLVNAYRVTTEGLPRFEELHNSYFPSSLDTPYILPIDISIDPRLDYTVGREGIPYRDWGIMEGLSWVRNPGNSGPFVNYKTVTDASQIGTHTQTGASNVSDLVINIIRLGDVYLMAAESAAQQGDLAYSLELVNKVRTRAAKLPSKQIVINGKTINAANYYISPYPNFPDISYAMKAIQWERRLELAMEGQRFFDLRRWGILKGTMDDYADYESEKIQITNTAPRDDFFFPIPQREIDNSKGVLTQHN